MLNLKRSPSAACGSHRLPPSPQCAQQPGTVLRIFIPPGAVINLLNLVELASPSGICFIIRLPLFGSGSCSEMNLKTVINAVQAAGGKAEIVS